MRMNSADCRRILRQMRMPGRCNAVATVKFRWLHIAGREHRKLLLIEDTTFAAACTGVAHVGILVGIYIVLLRIALGCWPGLSHKLTLNLIDRTLPFRHDIGG